MLKLERSVISSVARRFRSRAAVELENLALRHQLRVLRRQRPGRLRLFTFDLCVANYWFSTAISNSPHTTDESYWIAFRVTVMVDGTSHHHCNARGWSYRTCCERLDKLRLASTPPTHEGRQSAVDELNE